ncbi:hypothetical protein GQ464_009710 [Rhodocaloribacter litoris]|uniref:hypothetical protein n=1 Tax=Rhodocaloribacter litoris TaxID=2558931 RepID=UPI001422E7C5|nr:hypothetical protein [Rhodocaloribacter litoris]QXD13750.1 hypothetical protein GQ464_009710 [Rhodocaloribacter litoris]
MHLLRFLLPAGLVVVPALLAAGCGPSRPEAGVERPPLETYADSVAMRVYEAMGGPEAWARLRYLGFEFAFQPEGGERRPGRKHFWDRHTGAYRLEWTPGGDTTYVALFDVDTRDGTVYRNGAPVDSAEAHRLLQTAYRSFINDTYWLLMPVKLFDPGVNRLHVPDSSDAGTDVLRLTFGPVGLTPGDTYWVYVDRASGLVRHWAFVLQGRENQPPAHWDWAGYETFETPAGTIRLATRKVGAAGTLLTDRITLPERPPEGIFTDPVL